MTKFKKGDRVYIPECATVTTCTGTDQVPEDWRNQYATVMNNVPDSKGDISLRLDNGDPAFVEEHCPVYVSLVSYTLKDQQVSFEKQMKDLKAELGAPSLTISLVPDIERMTYLKLNQATKLLSVDTIAVHAVRDGLLTGKPLSANVYEFLREMFVDAFEGTLTV